METICDTSPLQYLHQLRQLELLPALAQRVVVPPAVVDELRQGLAQGVDLPDVASLDWISIRTPASAPALPLVTDLGPGESETLALALEAPGAVVVLDDRVARNVAKTLGLDVKGTLGVLLEAKHKGRLERVTPLLDELEALGFRLASQTRAAVMNLAGEQRE